MRKIINGIEASVWRKPGTAHRLCNIISMVKVASCCISEAGTGGLVTVEGKLNIAKNRDIFFKG